MKKIWLLFFMVCFVIASVSCDSKKSSSKKTTETTKTENTNTKNTTENKGVKSMDALNGKEGVFAVLETEKGEIVLELFYKDAPLTVTNFVGLAEGTLDAANGKPFYNGLKFHRVIADFMIQGGDPRGNGTGGPGYKFPDEFCDKYQFDGPGYLAMANSGTDTNGSQFFITHVPTDWLNNKHTIFGKVVTGQNVVDTVKQGDTIKKLTIIRQGADAEKFTCTQDDWNRELKNLVKANEEKKEKELASVIEGCTKSPEGIYYQILEKGNGTKVGKGKEVTVEYRGYLVDGSLFDASSGMHPQGHDPLSFTTAGGQMIPGFDLMVQDMEYGETRKMVLPPEYAYGSQGISGVIPGGAHICFDVQVVE